VKEATGRVTPPTPTAPPGADAASEEPIVTATDVPSDRESHPGAAPEPVTETSQKESDSAGPAVDLFEDQESPSQALDAGDRSTEFPLLATVRDAIDDLPAHLSNHLVAVDMDGIVVLALKRFEVRTAFAEDGGQIVRVVGNDAEAMICSTNDHVMGRLRDFIESVLAPQPKPGPAKAGGRRKKTVAA
jgi:hypothetical protein